MSGHTLILADPCDSGTERGAILTKVTGQAPNRDPLRPSSIVGSWPWEPWEPWLTEAMSVVVINVIAARTTRVVWN